jgi:glyoxylase-like metal-dependent hydrolase (beta-lactamase superfamily II)
MKIFLLETPEFKIDGGAYFGIIPKTIWELKYPADKRNMCKASCRSILIQDKNRLILFDTGIGEPSDDGKHDAYYVNFSENLITNLSKHNFKPDDITDVVLTHLHFDHCGGTSMSDKNTGDYLPVFKNATHYISQDQWQNALNPNYREKSSYHKDNFAFLSKSDKLVLVSEKMNITSNIQLRLFNGHTHGLMLPLISNEKRSFFFAGDLIPAMASIPLAWVSAYDLFPLTSINEKKQILEEAKNNNWIIIFQHDYYNECCDLKQTPRGVRPNNSFKFSQLS